MLYKPVCVQYFQFIEDIGITLLLVQCRGEHVFQIVEGALESGKAESIHKAVMQLNLISLKCNNSLLQKHVIELDFVNTN